MRALRPTTQYRPEWRAAHGNTHVEWLNHQRKYSTTYKGSWFNRAFIQLPLMALVLGVLGFFAQNSAVGLTLTITYGVAALALQLPSEHTFKVALVGLLSLPVFAAFNREELMSLYSQYVFLLLCFGVAGALLEQWHDHHSEVGLHVRPKVEGNRGPTI